MGGSKPESRRSDYQRLSSLLDQLPPDIAYLRKSILAIARQDRDLLGSGEADISSIEKALRRHPCADSRAEAARAADVLHRWIDGSDHRQEPWAGPIWFVEGALRGWSLFAEEDQDTRPARKPELGLQLLDVQVPAGMKTKPYVRGLEIKNREVQIIIGEVGEGDFEVECRKITELPPADWPRPPYLREDRDLQFKIGSATGFRLTSRHVETGLVVMEHYALTVGNAKFWVGVFARKDRGADLGKYDSVLASIRCKS